MTPGAQLLAILLCMSSVMTCAYSIIEYAFNDKQIDDSIAIGLLFSIVLMLSAIFIVIFSIGQSL